MATPIFIRGTQENLIEKKVHQSRWQRILLLFVLGYEGAGALAGGALLVAAPSGRLMEMPVDMMHGSFSNFMIPGIILFALGILNAIAFFAVLRKSRFDWFWAVTASLAMIGWFWIEIAVLLQLHWLHAMWGLPVLVGLLAAIPLVPHVVQRQSLLYCGILSSVLYAAINIIVPLHWHGYSYLSQVPSELSAIGSPTRTLWSVLATPYTFFVIAFGWGIYKVAADNRRLRTAGIMLIAYGALGFLWPFAPMHMRETLAAGGATFADTMHIALGVVTEVLYLLALGLAAGALGRKFRIFSIMTVIFVFVFAVLTFWEAPGIARNEPTPLVGLWERINIGIFLLWIVVLAMVLLQMEKKKEVSLQTKAELGNTERLETKTPQLL